MITGKRIYCSGPLFCPEEIAGMTHIARTLESAGHETFLPHRDGVEAYVLGRAGGPLARLPGMDSILGAIGKAIFALDVYQIVVRCDALVFNMNGRVPDEGGVVETAIAFAAGKPLVIYKEDVRSKVNGTDNAMLLGLAPKMSTVSSVSRLPAALEEVMKTMPESPYKGAAIPPAMRETLAYGEKVWQVLERLKGFGASVPRAADLVHELEALEESSGRPLQREEK